MARVIVIDDDQSVRFAVRQVLERENHEVLEAENGAKGIALCRKERPDLVITDIIMPDKEGIETIMSIKMEFPGIKVFAISGAARATNVDYLKMAKNLGADRAFHKPFDFDELVKAVAEATGGDA